MRERLDVNGAALIPLDEASVTPVLDAIAAERIESVAIGLLHSYANPAHERRLREMILVAYPGLPVSLSSDVSPEMREYQRFSTTVANAYVQPAVSVYLHRLERALAETGFAGALMAMLSNGGLATLDTAIRFPVRLVESGPGRRRDLCRRRRPSDRGGQSGFLRHRRHHGENLPDRRRPAPGGAGFRGRPRLPLQARQRPAPAHPGGGNGRDRRRRRLAVQRG